MKKIEILKAPKLIGKKVKLAGWVNSRRDMGQVIFIDLRDRSGIMQLVFTSSSEKEKKELRDLADSLRSEYVIEVEGKLQERPEGMENPKLETGKLEVEVEKMKILAKAKTLPFEITKDTKSVEEEKRMKYRYLDLRSERMRKNIICRHKAIKFIRDFLSEKDFIEIETPILTKSTPEGARDYIVPSRQQPGKFYALPQSPQQYKQLLMVAGMEKYFQIARCFRDEDPRGDRQPEHTQLDLEMSFVSQDDILELIESLYSALIKKLNQKKKKKDKKKISQIPFPKLDYAETIKKYKTDRPDLRKDKSDPNELAFCWIVNWPLFEWNATEKRWDPHHHIFTAPIKKDLPLLEKSPDKVHSEQYDLVLNGAEVGGGSIRISDPKTQMKIFELVGISKNEAEEKFGHLLKAFEYGVPPHGGIAAGLDRLLAILKKESSIREVIAFPKTGDGRDPMMGAPADVTKEQLKELQIEIKKKPKK